MNTKIKWFITSILLNRTPIDRQLYEKHVINEINNENRVEILFNIFEM